MIDLSLRTRLVVTAALLLGAFALWVDFAYSDSPPRRLSFRAPGALLAVAALIAGGLHGIDEGLELPDALEGNAYTSGAERLPTTLAEAAALFEGSTVAREAFGDDVVDHYLNYARVELKAFNSAVTDWERRRGFERL